jgi:hypothetical protein
MEHWDGTKSSIVEPYTLTKHCAGGQIHPRFIPAKPTDLEGNVVISPHIPGEKVCKTWKGDNCTHLLETASVEKKSSHKLRAAEQSIYFASSVWCLRPTLCWWSIKHSTVLGREKRLSSPCFRAFEKLWAFEKTYWIGKPTYGSLKKLTQTH